MEMNGVEGGGVGVGERERESYTLRLGAFGACVEETILAIAGVDGLVAPPPVRLPEKKKNKIGDDYLLK